MDTPAQRFKAIRNGLCLTQAEMAHHITRQAGALGLDLLCDTSMVAKIEQGVRKIDLEIGEVVATLDPMRRGALWLAGGPEPSASPMGSVANRRGRPATARELGLDTETPASKKKAGGKH